MSLRCHLLASKTSPYHQNTNLCLQIPSPKPSLFTKFVSLALTFTLNSPLPSSAIPSPNSLSPLPPSFSPTTPFSQSKSLQLGLQDGYSQSFPSFCLLYDSIVFSSSRFHGDSEGSCPIVGNALLFTVYLDGGFWRKIRPCPSINPGCVSSNPKSSSFSFPWRIPENSIDNAIQKLQDAIMKTQKNVKIQILEDTPYGQYLQAEIDGGFGRDVVEFLVKGDVVAYRILATKVTYVYPFTTAFGDSKGQEERLKKIVDELDWYAPSFDVMD